MSLYKMLLDCDSYIQTDIMKGPIKLTTTNFDLIKKSIYISKIPIMTNGTFTTDFIQKDEVLYETKGLELIDNQDLSEFGIKDLSIDPYKVIESLYEVYNKALDTRVSSVYRGNFVTEAQNGNFSLSAYSKDYARILLEGYVLLGGLKGIIPWSEENKFYWKSSLHPKLIVFKNMII